MPTYPRAVQPNLPSAVPPNADGADAFEIETKHDGPDRKSAGAGACYRLTKRAEGHNLFGRAYLFLITPFHKWSVRSGLFHAL